MIFTKSYSELINFPTFLERFEYLQFKEPVGKDTFGIHRYLNQNFYTSKEWRSLRDQVIVRDLGCDLGIEDRPIYGNVYIHHINPITIEDLNNRTEKLMSLENLICCSFETHNAIHFGDVEQVKKELIVRKPNDTCPWRL